VYASSGIRRRVEDGVTHEIDWALFEFSSERSPDSNLITNGERYCEQKQGHYPLTVAPTNALNDLNVHCLARTSGLQTGRILPGMTIVKIYGRQTPSSSYQVAGKLGVPGDSGAWVVDNEHGRACGHVLAWSSRKKVAYICPMDVLVRDIGETLHAHSISLPGGEELFPGRAMSMLDSRTISEPEKVGIEDEELNTLLRGLNLPPTPEQIDGVEPGFILDNTAHPDNLSIKSGKDESFIPIRMMSKGEGIGSGKASIRSFVKSAGRGRTESITMSEEDVELGDESGGRGL